MVRSASLALYAGLAALGIALLGRPAVLWVEALGLFHPVQPWTVPLGAPAALIAGLIGIVTLGLAVQAIVGTRPPRRGYHLALLLLVALALALRAASGKPVPRAKAGAHPAPGFDPLLPLYPHALPPAR